MIFFSLGEKVPERLQRGMCVCALQLKKTKQNKTMTSDEDTDREQDISIPKKKPKGVHAPQWFLTKYQDQWP